MTGPRVLTVLPDLPLPADTGLHLRMISNLELLAGVAAQNHVLWFATADRPPGSPTTGLEWLDSCVCAGPRREQHEMSMASKLAAKASFATNGVLGRRSDRYPFSMRYDAVEAAAAIRARALEVDADWVILPSQGMHWSRELAGVARVIVDAADVLSAVTQSLRDEASGAASRVSLWANHVASVTQERTVLPDVDEVWATSPAEAQLLQHLAGDVPILVIPNALDEGAISALAPATGNTVGFIGTYSYQPNLNAGLELAEQIFPRVLGSCADARLSLAGGGLPDHDVARLRGRDSVTVTGRIDDLDGWWEQLTVAVLPVRVRGGVPLKLVEALARGRAVVATPQLVEGLDLQDGVDLLVGDTHEELASAAVSVLADDSLRRDLERAGRRAFERLFSRAAARRELLSRSALCR